MALQDKSALPAGVFVGRPKPEPLPLRLPAHHDPLAIAVEPPPLDGAIGLIGRLQGHVGPAARVALADELLGAPGTVVAAEPLVVFLRYPTDRCFSVQFPVGKCWHAGQHVLADTRLRNSQLVGQCTLSRDAHDAEPGIESLACSFWRALERGRGRALPDLPPSGRKDPSKGEGLGWVP